MSVRFLKVLIFVCFEMRETAAFRSWAEPPIPSANGSGTATIRISEDHAINTYTGITVKAIGGVGNVSYTINNDLPYFSVDPFSGDFVLTSALDYEATEAINVPIGARDESVPPKTCLAVMTINIKDVNDNAPVFVNSNHRVNVIESSAIGVTILVLSTTDADIWSDHLFLISGGNARGDFAVDKLTGTLSIARSLMAFRQSTYLLSVIAVDRWGADTQALTATTPVTVVVERDTYTNACEPKTITVNVSTDLRVGEQVPVKVMCSNWKDDNPWFELANSAMALHFFNVTADINRMPRLVAMAPNPNSTWQVDLHAFDGPAKVKLVNSIRLTIRPIPMNDPPAIRPEYLTIEVVENSAIGTVVGILTVSDPDVGEWGEIRIESNDKPEFLDFGPIVDDKVELLVSGPVDAEEISRDDTRELVVRWDFDYDYGYMSEYGPDYIVEFQVVVVDKHGLNSSAHVSVNISDINDHAPVCNPAKVIKKIPRDIQLEGPIVALGDICRDDDLSTANSELYYDLVQDTCSAFTVNDSNGDIILSREVIFTQPSCNLLLKVQDNGTSPLSTHVTVEIQFLECPNDTDYLGIPWRRGVPGNYTWGSCPGGYRTGRVKRFCDEDGNYHQPIYNCTRSEIQDIYRHLIYHTYQPINILDDLVNITSRNGTRYPLLVGDIETINKILTIVTTRLIPNSPVIQNITESFVKVANALIDVGMTTTWKVIINETGSGADTVVDKLDTFVEKVVSAPDSNLTTSVYAKTNLMLKIGMHTLCDRGIHFPNRSHDVVPEWLAKTADSVNMPCSRNMTENETAAADSADTGWKSYSCAMYRDISKIMPSRSTDNESLAAINAPVMSFTYYPKIAGKLQNPVEITFELYDHKMGNPNCSFWTRNASTNGSWSVEGCWLDNYDREKNTVVCKCDHLTNFAVLMSPFGGSSKESDHHQALSIISMIGCVISMICLFLTVLVHVILWKTVKSVRTIIHINLSTTLFIAYLLFLAGIDRTENKGACTAIAILLHLVYLMVFFIMFTEGLNLAYIVLKPLSTRKPGIPLLAASYVISVVIVAVSMAAVQLEGYGNASFCWLSTDKGLIWAFLAPVLFIIVVNGIIICLVIRQMCGTVAMSRKANKEKVRAGVRSILILTPIMGITWVFGIFSVNEDTLIFQYLFAIFNSIQGVLIFICHCVMNKKVMEGLKKMVGKSKFKSTTSSSTETQKMASRSQATQNTNL